MDLRTIRFNKSKFNGEGVKHGRVNRKIKIH